MTAPGKPFNILVNTALADTAESARLHDVAVTRKALGDAADFFNPHPSSEFDDMNDANKYAASWLRARAASLSPETEKRR